MSDDFAVACRLHDEGEAEMVCDALCASGLHPRILGTRNATLFGAATFAFELRVEVPGEELIHAKELVANLLNEDDPELAETAAELEALSATDSDSIREATHSAHNAAVVETSSAAARADSVALTDVPTPLEARSDTSERARVHLEETSPAPAISTDPVWGPLLGLTAIHGVLLWASRWGDAARMRELGATVGWPAPAELYRLMTSNFLHFGPGHLIANTEGLVLYGWAAIALFGLQRTGFVYMLALLASGISSALVLGPHVTGAGASGGLFGLIALVLAGKALRAWRSPAGRSHGLVKIIGWALFALPPALYFDYAAHLAGVAVGLVSGCLLAQWSTTPSPAAVRNGTRLGYAAAALFLAPWAMRIAANFYSPCTTGNREGCVQACKTGDADACLAQGLHLLKLSGDVAEAREVLTQACTGGQVRSCGVLGSLLYQESTDNDEAAVAMLRRACDGGDLPGCVNLASAWLTIDGSRESDSVGLYRSACDAGAASGCAGLAWAFAYGRGDLVRDIDAALHLYSNACEHEEPNACMALGDRYAYGNGVEKSVSAALDFFAKACRRGEPAACDERKRIQRFGAAPASTWSEDEMADQHLVWINPLRTLWPQL